MARQLEWPFRVPERAMAQLARAIRAQARQRALRRGDLAEGVRQLRRFVAEVGGGRIEAPRAAGERVVVALHASDGERYLLEIRARCYLVEPPSCRFVDESGEPVATAWPGFHPEGPFRPPTFICTPPTAEFYAYHPEREYRHGEGTFENTVATIFAALHGRGYAGRSRRRGRPDGGDPLPG